MLSAMTMATRRAPFNTFVLCLLITLLGLVLNIHFLSLAGNIEVAHVKREVKAIELGVSTSQSFTAADENDTPAKIAVPFGEKSVDLRRDVATGFVNIPLSNSAWRREVGKGCQLVRLMNIGSDAAAALLQQSPQWASRPVQSIYVNPLLEFAKWGYQNSDRADWRTTVNFEDKPRMKAAMESLGLSSVVTDWAYIKTEHVDRWPSDTRANKPSKGYFDNWYIAKDSNTIGMLVDSMFSAQATAKRQQVPIPWPDLTAFSDVVFLQYYNTIAEGAIEGLDVPGINPAGGSQIPAPTHVLIADIITDTTQISMWSATKRAKVEPVPWPGTKWSIDTEFAQVILATPHGQGIAWFLIQHKANFGNKAVKSITVFVDEEDEDVEDIDEYVWNLYFEIGDAVAPTES